MVTRVIFGFVHLWTRILSHYFWSANKLRPTLGEIEFDASEAMSYRVGLLPVDSYSVAFKFDRYSQADRSVLESRSALVNQLRAEPIDVEITITGALGRRILDWTERDVLAWKDRTGRTWNLNQRDDDPMVRLYGPARFIAVPFERYTVSARIGGRNAFLSERKLILEFMVKRDDGYHGLGHVILLGLSGLLFALIAIVWIFVQLTAVVQRWR